jgi:hypothetical protein
MNDKGANIDLLFRNGLKDYEVLPPPGVWEGIHPAIKVKSQPVIFLRIAAAITVLVTVSFLTYRWSREISDTPSVPVMAFNVPVASPLKSVSNDIIQYVPQNRNDQVVNFAENSVEVDNTSIISDETVSAIYPEQIIYAQETKNFLSAGNQSLRGPALASAKTSFGNEPKLTYTELEYIPENIPEKPKNRWSIAAMASPTYYSSFNSGSDALSKQLSTTEQPLVSYSGGVVFSYKVSKRFSLQSGLYYSSLGQRVDGIDSYSGFQPYSSTKGDHNFEVLTTNGTVYTSNPDVFLAAKGSNRVLTSYTVDVFDPDKANLQPVNSSLDQNFSYLELPVVLKYKILDKTLGINLIGGLSYNLLVHNSVYTTVNGSKYAVGDTKGLNPMTLSSSLGMGMEYNISEKLSLNLEPTFRYYLSPFSVTTSSFIHPYSFGIFSGVSYKF